ncbi:MAG: STAS domain-containing protein [Acidimicrobiales bacterium]
MDQVPTSVCTDVRGLFIDYTRSAGGVRVVVAGEIDMASAPLLEDHLAVACNAAERVELDLSEVSFMDSQGLRVLLVAQRDSSVPITVVATSPRVRRVLDLTGTAGLLLA